MTKSFRDLLVFQRALDLMVEVYRITAQFPPTERYGLASQLRRASLSVLSQVAEGEGRLSPGEWRQFLSQARGSLFEVEAQMIAASRLGFVTESDSDSLQRLIGRVGKLLRGLIRFVQRLEANRADTSNPSRRSRPSRRSQP